MCLVIFLPGNVGNVSVPSGFARFRFMRCAATGYFHSDFLSETFGPIISFCWSILLLKLLVIR